MTTTKLDAAGHQWLAGLSTFDLHIHYRHGRKNKEADSLSRQPHFQNGADNSAEDDYCIEQFIACVVQEKDDAKVSADVVKAVCQRHRAHQASTTQPEHPPMPGSVDSVGIDVNVITPEYSHVNLLQGSCTLPRMFQQYRTLKQKKDHAISSDFHTERRKTPVSLRQHEDIEVQLMLCLWNQLT